MPNEVSLIAASFVNTVLYAIGASVALAFIGLADLTSWSLGTMLYWAQSQQALPIGAWWWFVPPGLAVALMGTALVLLNSGIDELGNPRLRDAGGASAAYHGDQPLANRLISQYGMPRHLRNRLDYASAVGVDVTGLFQLTQSAIARCRSPRGRRAFGGHSAALQQIIADAAALAP